MSAYLTAAELADMIECEPNQYACMRRWLTKHEWPFEVSKRGLPKVSRAYHAARMSGTAGTVMPFDAIVEPDFSMFQ
jgi:hypothetical protein